MAKGAATLQGWSHCHCTSLVTRLREDVGPTTTSVVVPEPLTHVGVAKANGLPGRKLPADVGNSELPMTDASE